MLLAINPGGIAQSVPGTQTRDPAFGLPAIWIEPRTRDAAQVLGYTVVDCATVIATHINHLLLSHAGQLLGRQEVQALIDHIGKFAPKLVDDVVPKLIPLATMQRVLQNLLDEGVPIRDMRTIVETLADAAQRTTDATELTAQVRSALRASIAQTLFGMTRELSVIALDPELEKVLVQSVSGAGSDVPAIEPGLVDLIQRGAAQAAQRQEDMGLAPTLLVPDRLRGRVLSLYSLCWNMLPLGGLLAGVLAAAVSARFAVLVGGAVVAANALLFLASRRLRALR